MNDANNASSQIPIGNFNLSTISQMQSKNMQTINNINSPNKIVPVFLSRFINDSFMENIINICLYQSDFASLSSRPGDVVNFMNKFLIDVHSEVNKSPISYFTVPKTIILSSIKITQQVLDLREDVTRRLVTYDNVFQHFQKRDLHTEKLLRSVSNNRLRNGDEFKKIFDIVTQTIQAYNEVQKIRKTLLYWDSFLEDSNRDNLSALNLVKNYRDLIANAYNELSTLTTITKVESLDDYILISDKSSTKKVVNNLISFLDSGYSFYKTGYPLIDDAIGGIEAATMSLITGPSNHAKSIFMINIARNIACHPKNDFEKGDVIVFITLEDDIYKLLRRFISIFGNIDTQLVRKLFIKASSLMKLQNYKDINNKESLSNEISKILTELINESIVKTNGGKCKFVIKHCNENVFSMNDATKFIDMLRLEGYKTKILFIDYVDMMVPSNSKYSDYNDYNAHGSIIHEMRLASRVYSIPVISITQNSKESENFGQQLSNQSIGDSYKKVRYSDYIIMVRMRTELDLLSPQVKSDVVNYQDGDKQISMIDMTGQHLGNIVPFEAKITKAKEGKKDIIKFHIFSGSNLKIYSTLDEFFKDTNSFKRNSSWLQNQIDLLGMNAMQNTNTVDQFEISLV